MKLTGLQIEGFGVWNDLGLDELSSGVTVLYGRNEAGKTTLMHFIRSILYGYSPARRQRFLPPHAGGRPGGWLTVDLPVGSVRLARYADIDAGLGHLTATTDDGPLPVDATLRSILGDIDEATFNNVYAVGLREMQELGTLSDTDAAQWLYSLTTGLDRVSLLDVVRELESSRERLLSSEGRPSRITELLDRRSQLQDEIDQFVTQGRRWSQVTVKLQELGVGVERLETERDRLKRRAQTIEIAIHVKPTWMQRIDLDRQLAAHDGRIRLPDDARKRLDDINAEIEEHERQREVLKRQRHGLRDEAETLGVNELLVRNASRIEALGEQRDWLEALQRQQSALTEELKTIESQLADEHEQLGFDLKSVNVDKKKIPEISEGLVNSLRPHAKAVRESRERLGVVQREADAKRETEDEYRAQLVSAMPEAANSKLPTDLESAGELVANLRKRLHIEQRLEQARRHEVELQQQNHELLDRQETSLWTSAALAILLFIGLAFLAYGLIAPSFAAKVFGGAALACFFGWHFFRYLDEDRISQRREEVHRQHGLARNQIDAADKEKSELEEILGPTNRSVVVQLQTAERHLGEMEKLLPVETCRREARQEAESADRRVAEAERKLEAALAGWQKKLKGLGLPHDLTPHDIRALASRYEQVTDLRLCAERRRGDAEQRQREYAALCKRIRNLAEEVHLLLPDAGPLVQLEHLESCLRQHGMRVEERNRLQTKAKELRESETRHGRAADAIRHRCESTFVHAGVEDETAYRLLFREQQQADATRKERSTVCREIAAAIGSHVPEPEIADLLGPESVGLLDRWWEDATAELENTEEQLKELVATRGALRLELKQLAADQSLAERQLDLATVEEQLKRAAARWRARAATSNVLDEVRARYEKERQPETLVTASAHLTRLTDGTYRRVWTPLGKEILFVDNADGESLAVEVLSRGAREQLFLSLRLALVSRLARHGLRLPMVLDDVLVNFDEGRAQKAVQVLKEFAAEGHQLLVFTCHEHVYQMFREQQLDARRLSDRLVAAEPERVVDAMPPAVINASYEYLLSEEDGVDMPEPPPIEVEEVEEVEEEVVARTQKPKPRRQPKPRAALELKPVSIVPPPRVREVVIEPETEDDEWIRIGPQVRRRDRTERRTGREHGLSQNGILDESATRTPVDLSELSHDDEIDTLDDQATGDRRPAQESVDRVYAEDDSEDLLDEVTDNAIEDIDSMKGVADEKDEADGEYEYEYEVDDTVADEGDEYEGDEYEGDEYEDDEYEDDEYEDDEYEDDEADEYEDEYEEEGERDEEGEEGEGEEYEESEDGHEYAEEEDDESAAA